MANTLVPMVVTELGTSFSTIYTVPGGANATVTLAHIVNTTGSAQTFRLCVVPAAGSPVQANSLFWDFTLAGNAVVEFLKGGILGPGVTVRALAGAANAVNVAISTIESS